MTVRALLGRQRPKRGEAGSATGSGARALETVAARIGTFLPQLETRARAGRFFNETFSGGRPAQSGAVGRGRARSDVAREVAAGGERDMGCSGSAGRSAKECDALLRRCHAVLLLCAWGRCLSCLTILSAVMQKVALLWPRPGERVQRVPAASGAWQLGHGRCRPSMARVGCRTSRLRKAATSSRRLRCQRGRAWCPGGGRPAHLALEPGLPALLQAFVEPLTRGDPESLLRWTSESTGPFGLGGEPAPSGQWREGRAVAASSCCEQRTMVCRGIGPPRSRTITRAATRTFWTSTIRSAFRSSQRAW